MITPPKRGLNGMSRVCTRSIDSRQRAPSCVTKLALPFTESRVAPRSHAENFAEPWITATLFEYGPCSAL